MGRANPKVYLVTRDDLPAGQQAVQAAHALTEFTMTHMALTKAWYESSNHLAMLAVPNEGALTALLKAALKAHFKVVPFFEPDRNDELTAIALEPEARDFLKGLPLALRC